MIYIQVWGWDHSGVLLILIVLLTPLKKESNTAMLGLTTFLSAFSP